MPPLQPQAGQSYVATQLLLLLCYLLQGVAGAWLPAGVLHPALSVLGWSGPLEPECRLPAHLDMERGSNCCLHCWLCGVVQKEGDLQVCASCCAASLPAWCALGTQVMPSRSDLYRPSLHCLLPIYSPSLMVLPCPPSLLPISLPLLSPFPPLPPPPLPSSPFPRSLPSSTDMTQSTEFTVAQCASLLFY